MTILKWILLSFTLCFSLATFSQATGNYDYRSEKNFNYIPNSVIPQAPSLARMQGVGNFDFSIKGLYNCKADSYLAIFTITQVGQTQTEADDLVKAKTMAIEKHLQDLAMDAELYIDMISFLPIYEYEATKKLFSKKTYNEIPKGFELKKNLHFRYSDPKVLEYLVTICAEQEIYDLVRVDYFIEDLEQKQAEMIAKAEALLMKKMARYERLTREKFDNKQISLGDGFAMHYPLEQYRTYQAYHSNKLNIQQGSNITQSAKTTSQFYMPKMSKGYDFVLNPSLLEPVVQIEYEVRLQLFPKPEKPKEQEVKEIVKKEIIKQLFWVTPNGDLKQLQF